MHFSDEKILHYSHLIVNAIYFDDLVDYDDEEAVRKEVKKVMSDFFGMDEKIDAFVKNKIRSLKRKVQPAGREWEVLYQKYFEEEMKKRGLM